MSPLPYDFFLRLDPLVWLLATAAAREVAVYGSFALALWLVRKKRHVQCLLLLPAAMVLVLTVYSSHVLIPRLEAHKSPRAFCAEITSRLNEGAQWAMYRYYRAAYVYYTDSFTSVLHNQYQLEEFMDQPGLAIVATPQKEFDKVKDKLNLIVYICNIQ